MKHLRSISHPQRPAPGATSLVEQIIVVVMTILFADWDNGPQVIQALSQFYAKTNE